jgi:predicted metal-binding protein
VLKVGIIRCQQTEDLCPGSTDFSVARAGKGAFEATGPAEVIGLVSCGGCPGKRAVSRAKVMIDRGADAIRTAFRARTSLLYERRCRGRSGRTSR